LSPTPFRINVSSLEGSPNSRRELSRSGALADLQTSGAAVDPASEVSFSGFVDWIDGKRLVLTGTVNAPWSGECRRCAVTASGEVNAEVREIFEPTPTEGETYPLTGDVIDIEPMIREAVMLELPVAPLCRDDCKGLCPECGVNHNEATCDCKVDVTDPRWAGLDMFKQD
jgi:uncharacterized protein